ncbi:MAG: DUF1569 domain-containing protein [Pseudomonadota bacterium]
MTTHESAHLQPGSKPSSAADINRRRRLALQSLGTGALVLGAAPLLSACSPGAISPAAFNTIDNALQTLEKLRNHPLHTDGAWDLAHVLHHVAQSIEYSLHGFPALKPAWFRSTIGPMAFAIFSARGQMSHSLDEAIPGAPAIPQAQPLPPAIDHLVAALQSFAKHSGPLMPHFAYGELDKPEYTRAHLMHLANHWKEVIA